MPLSVRLSSGVDPGGGEKNRCPLKPPGVGTFSATCFSRFGVLFTLPTTALGPPLPVRPARETDANGLPGVLFVLRQF